MSINLNALNNNLDLNDKDIKLSKLLKTPLNVALQHIEVEKLLCSLVILISRNKIALFSSSSKVNLMLECCQVRSQKLFNMFFRLN